MGFLSRKHGPDDLPLRKRSPRVLGFRLVGASSRASAMRVANVASESEETSSMRYAAKMRSTQRRLDSATRWKVQGLRPCLSSRTSNLLRSASCATYSYSVDGCSR